MKLQISFFIIKIFYQFEKKNFLTLNFFFDILKMDLFYKTFLR